MRRYFYLQLKRLLRIFPLLLAGLLISLLCVGVIAGTMWQKDQQSADQQKFKIAISGDTSGEYVQMGVMALQAFDDTRFAMEILELPEEDARRQLLAGQIAAYVVLPENFIQRALRGDMDKVTYVTSAGGESVVSMFKDEVTRLITDLVVYTQKGVYAVAEAVEQNKVPGSVGKHMDDMSLAYIDLILSRSQLCVVEELGVGENLSVAEYYVCSLSVFLLLFVGVAFVTVGAGQDPALSRLLASRGFSQGAQVFWEFLAQFAVLAALGAALMGIVSVAIPRILGEEMPGFFALLLSVLPVAAMAAAGNMLVFQLTGSVVNGAVWHFFFTVGQCYVSGCFYPVYALPQPLQTLAPWLPAGVARTFLAGCFTEEFMWLPFAAMAVFTAAALSGTALLRRGKGARQ